jgi:hypothetical protein
MHGDYQFANVMYHDGAPARLAAIVDWEMGTVGEPKLDRASMVQSWPADTQAREASEASYVDLTGMPSRSQLLAPYADVSGRQVGDIDYYVILAKWKLAVVLEQGFQRAGDDEKLQLRTDRAAAHERCRGARRDRRLRLVTCDGSALPRARRGARLRSVQPRWVPTRRSRRLSARRWSAAVRPRPSPGQPATSESVVSPQFVVVQLETRATEGEHVEVFPSPASVAS